MDASSAEFNRGCISTSSFLSPSQTKVLTKYTSDLVKGLVGKRRAERAVLCDSWHLETCAEDGKGRRGLEVAGRGWGGRTVLGGTGQRVGRGMTVLEWPYYRQQRPGAGMSARAGIDNRLL